MAKCKKCRKQRKFLSQKGYCDPCSDKIRNLVVAQLRAKEGKYYERWKEGMAKSIEGTKPKKKVRVKRK